MKSTQSHIYDQTWKCCICSLEDETFNHIWICNKNTQIMSDIVSNTKQYLLNQLVLLNYIPPDNLYHYIDNDDIWLLDTNQDSLTFIDLIKGIIPSKFFNIINNITNSNKQTNSIINNTTNYLFELTY